MGEEVMTDYQYETVLKSIILILKGCKDLDEAQKKIESLLKENKNNEDA
ncbi:MAG: hypothetical protein K5639_01815 [Eubacterium sp.]|nr:hypothetical protein [Eubacterium sp.]